ncbi:hypothetical protein PM082_004508 [Marasmius tenuissimus]|nr:hypothetical protein PM082_004508 [Marasmius tenuissimus]
MPRRLNICSEQSFEVSPRFCDQKRDRRSSTKYSLVRRIDPDSFTAFSIYKTDNTILSSRSKDCKSEFTSIDWWYQIK